MSGFYTHDEYVNRIVNHLARRGTIEEELPFESPFTDVHPLSLDGLFQEESVLALLAALHAVRQNAIGLPQ